MRIELDTLRFKGLFSFKDEVSIRLNNHKITQLVGENGAGKTSISLVLEELLFNTNNKGLKKAQIVNRNSKSYFIELTFKVNSDSYILHKEGTGASPKLKLVKNGKDISGHTATQTYSILTELFGSVYKVLPSLMFQNLKSSSDFLLATDSERKKFWTDLLGLEEYPVLRDKAKEKEKEIKSSLVILENKIKTLNTAMSSLVSGALKEEVPPTEPDFSDLQNPLAELRAKKANIVENNRRATTYTQKLNELNKLLSAKPTQVNECKTDAIQELTSEAAVLSAKLSQIKAEHTNLSAVKDTCPTCKQKLPEFDKSIPEKIAALKDEYKSLKPRLEELTGIIEKERSNKKLYDEYQAWQTKVELAKASLPEEATQETTETLDTEINRLSSLISFMENSYRAKLSEYASNKAFNEALKKAENTRVEFETSLAETKSQVDKLLPVLSDLDVLLDALSPKGVISFVIESSVQVIQHYINEYLLEISDGRFKLFFKADATKLTIEIQDKDELVDIKALSTGQFNKVNAATLLAIRKIMSHNRQADINFLFIDELISTLDTNSKYILTRILLQEPSLNTFIVSHDWRDPLVPILEVVQDMEGNSRIINEF